MELQRIVINLLWWKNKRRKRKDRKSSKCAALLSFSSTKYTLLSMLVHSTLLLSLIADICYACGPGRGGIRRRGPRKLTPLVYRQHIPNFSERSLAASGLTLGPIDRIDERFRKLVPNYNPDVIFKDEENTGADRLMTQRCKEKLNTLAISVMNQWPGIRLRVTEAWDEDHHHADNSLHYEGRAIDITTSDRDRRKYGLLARLAVESGFDWVYYESRSHVHVSCKSEATHPSKAGGCFTGSNTVMLENGKRQKMSDLKVGDSVLTVDTYGDYKFSPVILFLDRAPEDKRQFYVIQTDSGHSLTLTPSHLIYTKYQSEHEGDLNTKESDLRTNSIDSDSVNNDIESFQAGYASNVREGDFVLVFDSKDGLKPSRVLKIETIVQTGVYAPLTSQGNLVVDDVLVSCYALIDSQTIAHLSFAPLRWWHSIKAFLPYSEEERDVYYELNESGIHWYANDLYSLAEKIMPSKLWTK